MKKFINKILDVPKLILRLWIILWICLIVLLVMKFCFGIWYPIVIKNQALLDFNNYIDSTWLKWLFLGIFYTFSGNILYLTSCKKKKFSNIVEFILINITIILTLYVKTQIYWLGITLEIIISVVIPIIYLIKTNKYINKFILILYPIAIQGIVFLWQSNILLVRGLPANLEDVGTIFQIVLQIDYYVFLSVLWIGVSFMGFISFWIFCKDVTTLKAIKARELAKSKPNKKMIKEIDEKIAKLEATK